MEPDRILVVDDDARIRQMLVRYFEGNGNVSLFGEDAVMLHAHNRQQFFQCSFHHLSFLH